MRPHGGIDAHGKRTELLCRRPVKRAAHAMQALMLDGDARALRHRSHRRQSVGVVGGELGIEIGMGLDQ